MNVLDITQEEEEQKERAEQALKLLIAEQGVEPITDLDHLSDLWIAEDDPDLLMDFILQERAARRQLNNKGISE